MNAHVNGPKGKSHGCTPRDVPNMAASRSPKLLATSNHRPKKASRREDGESGELLLIAFFFSALTTLVSGAPTQRDEMQPGRHRRVHCSSLVRPILHDDHCAGSEATFLSLALSDKNGPYHPGDPITSR
jgi:hypothetical protein